jgi:glutamate N-acetyltransferase/amino-acid N-acetyltransferase
MVQKVSPLAPAQLPELPNIEGVKLAAADVGIRYRGRPDVMLALLDPGTSIAGVFTRSLTRSAPVDFCAQNLRHNGKARAIVVNAGNANAFTGKIGVESVSSVAKATAEAVGCKDDEVFIASTGVIGEPLDPAPIIRALPKLVGAAAPGSWQEASRAILTTDTFPKMVTIPANYGGKEVRINGFGKGSGMIAPEMATMLAFFFTDAEVPQHVLQELLSAVAATTFNCVTVDGDTSTSDTVLFAATGAAGAGPKNLKDMRDPRFKAFAQSFAVAAEELAHLVVKDGEGAEKFVTITVKSAATWKEARQIGMSIANSPLVKTAIAGEDANWGRIVAAVGKSGAKAERDRLGISIGGRKVASNGRRDPSYREGDIAEHMKGRFIDIEVDVGVGAETATVWTTDLTHRYIDINGSYRS